MTTVEDAVGRTRRANTRRIATRHGWTIGVYVLLVLLIIAYAWALAPVVFTSFDLASIVIGALPLVFAAMAQAVIVISGGIDLSLGVIVAVINVSAASLMEGQSFATALLIAFGLMLLGALIGAINGGLCVVSGVPDIVVTLAMSFVWGGTALLIMRTPGGGAPTRFQSLGTGSFISMWIPAGAVIIALVAAAVWVPLRWRRPGFAIYAIGSNRDRAYLSGVNVASTRVLAYAVGGFFAAMGGLAATATTGIGTPYAGNFITLNSVAAVVLGGVSLAGGKGGLVGPVAAAFCLTLVPSIMVFQGIDPNYGQVIQGALIVLVVMLGGLLLLRERR
jgi:ribose transport system permease protein